MGLGSTETVGTLGDCQSAVSSIQPEVCKARLLTDYPKPPTSRKSINTGGRGRWTCQQLNGALGYQDHDRRCWPGRRSLNCRIAAGWRRCLLLWDGLGFLADGLLRHGLSTHQEQRHDELRKCQRNELHRPLWISVNAAHALMFVDRVDEVRTIYLKYRGTQNIDEGKSCDNLVLVTSPNSARRELVDGQDQMAGITVKTRPELLFSSDALRGLSNLAREPFGWQQSKRVI